MSSSSRRNGRRASVVPPKDQTRLKIERMEAEREERRRAMIKRKQERAQEEQRNIAAGNPGDVDFIGMVNAWRESNASAEQPHNDMEHPRICICVRKRPISDKERERNDHDSVTCLNPAVWIHSAKFKVDGITKYLDHSSFRFDHAFGETVSTEEVYQHTAMPLVDFCVGSGGRGTIFAYGQTGSGKTYTMNGIQRLLCEDLYLLLNSDEASEDTMVMVSFFELYGGYVQDLLNSSKRLKVLEDGKGEVVVTGLQELYAESPDRFMEILEAGNQARTTRTTEANDTSSRSHAICQIILRDRATDKLRGKLSLVDLAGSERGADTKSHDSQRRTESADINTSLLALKECIRALDKKSGAKHVPYRASKLTLILKDCFTSESAMTTMIATVSPGASAADHSLNTLRYADRIKEKKKSEGAKGVTIRKRRPQQKSPTNQTSRSPSGESPASVELCQPSDSNDSQTRKLFEQEEAALNMHMGFISENAQLLAEEGSILKEVQKENVTDEDIDRYATALERILDRKEDMILALQRQLAKLQQN